MIIKLPKKCSGQEIVEAFKKASSLQETPDRKWKSKDFIGESQYEPHPIRRTVRTVRSMGVRVHSLSLRKKGLFGEKVWNDDFNGAYTFTLKPVLLANNYDEIEVVVSLRGDIDVHNIQPHSIEFEDNLRPLFEQILANFYTHLQSQSA